MPPPDCGWSGARATRCIGRPSWGAVPVLTLLVAYAQISRFQADFRWAIVALALAGGLTGHGRMGNGRQRPATRRSAGRAGAAAALALAVAR